MIIKNFEELSTTPLRRDALTILEAGYEAINTEQALRDAIRMEGDALCIAAERFVCTHYERIFVIAIGKCAVAGATALESILGEQLTGGVVIDVISGSFARLRSFVGTHPFPSQQNAEAAGEVASLLTGLTERDLVLVLISGGGSSLLCLPNDLSCEGVSELTHTLMRAGASIQELNTVRKHLSRVQGGQLAVLARPATLISLIISDVPGNDLSMIASGPTVLDGTTVADAQAVLARYHVSGEYHFIETPKDPALFTHVHNTLLVTNERALNAMANRARALGYATEIVSAKLTDDARSALTTLAQELPPKTCRLAGGEMTLTVSGGGVGGRNQEAALAALGTVAADVLALAAASDGWDNSPAAGAIADAESYQHAQQKSLAIAEYLRDNNSYEFWHALGAHIVTGKTSTNVADLLLVLRA